MFDNNAFAFVVIVGVIVIRCLIVKNLCHAVLVCLVIVAVKFHYRLSSSIMVLSCEKASKSFIVVNLVICISFASYRRFCVFSEDFFSFGSKCRCIVVVEFWIIGLHFSASSRD